MPDVSHSERTDRFDLKALYETSRLLSASLDMEFVLGNLLLTAMSKLLVTRGLVLIYEPIEACYRVASSKGLSALPAGARIEVQVSGADVVQGDAVPDALAEHGVALLLPVVSGHREIGLIGLGRKATRQPFGSRELEFIHSLVHMSSAAVHNSLMVEELKLANRDLDAKVQQLNTLFDLSQEFNATIDRDRLAKLLSFALMGQMLVQKHLFLLRREGPEGVPQLHVVAGKGVSAVPLAATLVQDLCELNEMRLLDDELPADEAARWQRLRSDGLALLLPIRHQGKTCGILALGPKMTGQPYQPDDIEFLYALGNLAFVSIQNSYLVEEQIEKERLEEEMRLARHIQERLLPQRLPEVPGLDVAALAIPSREVGGDYYEVVRLEGGRALLAVADVTGKGLPASLLMANIQASLHTLLPMDITLEEATAHINRVICRNTDYDKFITFAHGIYDAAARTFRYVNAGHNPPMVLRADGTLELLEVGGLLLGVMDGMPYDSAMISLAPGDLLTLFTDGVTEAMSPEGEEYGEDRLEACLRAHHGGTAQEVLDAVHADIMAFTRNPALLSDDLTIIVGKVGA